MNVKTKEVPRMRYSKGWETLSEACMRTTRRKLSEGLMGDTYWPIFMLTICMFLLTLAYILANMYAMLKVTYVCYVESYICMLC